MISQNNFNDCDDFSKYIINELENKYINHTINMEDDMEDNVENDINDDIIIDENILNIIKFKEIEDRHKTTIKNMDIKCFFNGCNNNAIYSKIKNIIPTHCKNHKLNDMILFGVSERCHDKYCLGYPRFNYINTVKGLYCNNHKKPFMLNIYNNLCANGDCTNRINKKYLCICFSCFVELAPSTHPLYFNYKIKENAVFKYIKNEFSNIEIINNKRIINSKSHFLPDFYINLGHQSIIIEIDENQHNTYNSQYENNRIEQFIKDIKHPIIFIRFNPDAYKNKFKKIPSCWIKNSNKKCIINPLFQDEWNNRLLTLKNEINFWINNKSDKPIHFVYLFFDTINKLTI
jgi:hypothetical protein